MATISSTLALNDSMTPVLRSIVSALESVNATLDRLDATLSRAFDPSAIAATTTAVQATERAVDDVTQSVQATERVQDEVTESVQQTERAVEETERAQDDVTQSVRESSDAAGDLWKKIKGIVAAYLGWEMVKQTVAWSDEITNIKARLDAANDGTQTTAQYMTDIYEAAQRSHAPFQQTADLVGKLRNNAAEAFQNNAEAIAFAEQLNKQFSIAGASQQGAADATFQLIQALGSGALRGEELNSVLDQAPNIVRTIAEHMGVPIGEIRKLASEGKITADVVKNAILGATDKTNAAFAKVPLTFSSAWTMAKNTFEKNMLGLQEVISGAFNTAQFQQMMDGLTSAVSRLASFAIPLVKGFAAVVGFLYDNWSLIAPVVLTVTGALVAYKGAVLGVSAAEAIGKGVKLAMAIASYAKAAATGTEVAATAAATAAQWGLNTALLACPLTWIIAAIIAIVGLVYLVIAGINKAAGTTISATGVIWGALVTFGAFIANLFFGIYNGFLSLLDLLIDPVISIIDWFYTAFTGGFDSIGDACLNILGKIVSGALAVVKPILEIWDWVTGMNSAGAVEAAQRAAEEWGKNPEAKKKKTMKTGFLRSTLGADKSLRTNYSDAWNTGYKEGDSFSGGGAAKNALGLANDPAIQQIMDAQNQGNKLAAQTAKNTTPKAEEDYKYIKEIMAGRATDRLSGTEIRIEMNNNNQVNSSLDLDNIVNELARKLTGAMDSAAEGVHI
jgi:tape measure domain-containing protein